MAPVGCHTRWPYAGIHTLYTPFCTMGTRQHPDGGHGGRGCCTHAWYTRRCCCWADARGGSSRQRRRSGGAPADAPPAEGSGHDRPHAGCAATVRQSPRQLNRGFRAVVGPRGRHAFSSSSTSPRRHSHVFGLRAARATLKPLCTLMSATAVQRTELLYRSDWLHAGGAGCRSRSRSSPHLSLRTAAAPAAVHGTGQHARPRQQRGGSISSCQQAARHGRTVQPGFWNNYVHKSVFSTPAPGSVLAAAWPDQPVRVPYD
jgi:hypothetical protein